MKVLVTGHHGYIGSVMVPTLLDAGHDVVGMDTDLYGDCPFGQHARERHRVHPRRHQGHLDRRVDRIGRGGPLGRAVQ